MSSAQYDENRQLRTGMASETCLLSSRMQNTWPKKVYDTIHEYCVILSIFGHTRQYLKILSLTCTMLSTRYSLHLHIKLPPQGPRVHKINWAAISTAWSRISTGNAPVKTIGATVPICNRWWICSRWTFWNCIECECWPGMLWHVVCNILYFWKLVLILFWFSIEDRHWFCSYGLAIVLPEAASNTLCFCCFVDLSCHGSISRKRFFGQVHYWQAPVQRDATD